METEFAQQTETVVETSTPASDPTPVSQEPSSQPSPETEKPSPELSLRDKIQQKADAAAAKRAKDPKTGQFLPNSPQKVPPVAPVDPNLPPSPPTFTPNYKLKVMEQEREIPELLRSLIKDADSEKAVREIMEKAFGLEYVKPKLESTRQQLQTITGENQTIKTQISNLRTLYNRGDISGWIQQLGASEEKLLQYFIDKITYNQLPAEQKAILDQRRDAEERAWKAEDQSSSYQRQHEQILTQQVQMALDSVLARPEVNAIAKQFDSKHGANAFRAEISRRGDYIWRTKGELVAPDKLVEDFTAFLGPVSSPTPAAPQAAQAQAGLPAQPQMAAPQQQAKTPVIPNISGRSASALPAKVKSVDDIRAKYRELSTQGR